MPHEQDVVTRHRALQRGSREVRHRAIFPPWRARADPSRLATHRGWRLDWFGVPSLLDGFAYELAGVAMPACVISRCAAAAVSSGIAIAPPSEPLKEIAGQSPGKRRVGSYPRR